MNQNAMTDIQGIILDPRIEVILTPEGKALQKSLSKELVAYGTPHSAAFDLRLAAFSTPAFSTPVNERDLILGAGEWATIYTGLRIHLGSWTTRQDLPTAYAGLIAVRSSMSNKGLALRNSVAFIDQDYQGELMLKVCNTLHTGSLRIEYGERVAQYMVVPCARPVFTQVEEFTTSTVRGDGGFGSTGVK